MISHEVVTKTWQDMCQLPIDEVPTITQQMKDEQPVVQGFLLATEDMPFDEYERELIFYIGLVVWRIMRQSERPLRKVTRTKLRKAEEANMEVLESFVASGEVGLVEYTKHLVETHPEPEVFRYVVEAIMEKDPPDEPGFSDENKGLAFIHLKIVLDAFVSSLPPGPRPRLDA